MKNANNPSEQVRLLLWLPMFLVLRVAIRVLQKEVGLKKQFHCVTLSHDFIVAPRRGRKFSLW